MKEKKLMLQVRELLRLRHYSIRTEQAYVHWILEFINFHGTKHPKIMSAKEIQCFLTHLAVKRNVAASTQNQALNALVFLYKQVLTQDPGDFSNVIRAKKPIRIPVVLSISEVQCILNALTGTQHTIISLLYGSGLRILECLRLRIQDIDFQRKQIHIHSAKGDKDRKTMLPNSIYSSLQKQIIYAKSLHEMDLHSGNGSVYIPYAFSLKSPNASTEFKWQYLFPSGNFSKDPRSTLTRRHHYSESATNRAIRKASNIAQLTKRVTAHTFRHSYATHLVEDGIPLHEIQELLGHKSLETTKIYLHTAQSGGVNRKSPLDKLCEKI